MIFPKATKINAYAIHKLLHEYAQNSCQQPSPTKWNVLGGSISSIRMRHVAGILGFHIIQENFDYLKLPMFKGKPRVQHLQPIAHRVIAKLDTWKEHSQIRYMERTHQIQLLNSVIHDMLLYNLKIYEGMFHSSIN